MTTPTPEHRRKQPATPAEERSAVRALAARRVALLSLIAALLAFLALTTYVAARTSAQLDIVTATNRDLVRQNTILSADFRQLRDEFAQSQAEAEERSRMALQQRREQTRQLRILERLLRDSGIDVPGASTPQRSAGAASTPRSRTTTRPTAPSQAAPGQQRPAPRPDPPTQQPTPARPTPTPAEPDRGVIGDLLDLIL